MSGITLAAMRIAMKSDAMGSKPVQPYLLISNVEMMTPTEPSVSCEVLFELYFVSPVT